MKGQDGLKDGRIIDGFVEMLGISVFNFECKLFVFPNKMVFGHPGVDNVHGMGDHVAFQVGTQIFPFVLELVQVPAVRNSLVRKKIFEIEKKSTKRIKITVAYLDSDHVYFL